MMHRVPFNIEAEAKCLPFCNRLFQIIFLNENGYNFTRISLKYSKVPISNKPAFAQIIACLRSGDKPLSEPVMACFT